MSAEANHFHFIFFGSLTFAKVPPSAVWVSEWASKWIKSVRGGHYLQPAAARVHRRRKTDAIVKINYMTRDRINRRTCVCLSVSVSSQSSADFIVCLIIQQIDILMTRGYSPIPRWSWYQSGEGKSEWKWGEGAAQHSTAVAEQWLASTCWSWNSEEHKIAFIVQCCAGGQTDVSSSTRELRIKWFCWWSGL